MTHSCRGGKYRHGRSCRLPFIEPSNVFVHSLLAAPLPFLLPYHSHRKRPVALLVGQTSASLRAMCCPLIADRRAIGAAGAMASRRLFLLSAHNGGRIPHGRVPLAARCWEAMFLPLPHWAYTPVFAILSVPVDCRSVRLFLFEEPCFSIPAESALRCRAPSFSQLFFSPVNNHFPDAKIVCRQARICDA